MCYFCSEGHEIVCLCIIMYKCTMHCYLPPILWYILSQHWPYFEIILNINIKYKPFVRPLPREFLWWESNNKFIAALSTSLIKQANSNQGKLVLHPQVWRHKMHIKLISMWYLVHYTPLHGWKGNFMYVCTVELPKT